MTVAVLQQVTSETHGSLHANEATTITGVTVNSVFHYGITFDTSNGSTDANLTSVPVLTWTKLDSQNDTTDSELTQQWVSNAVSVGGNFTTTAAFNTAQTGHSAALIKEIGGTSGYQTGSHASGQQATPGTGADGVTTGNTPALTAQPALVSAFAMDSAGGGTPAAGTGFTNDGAGWNGFTGTNLMRSESKRVTSTAAVAGTFNAAVNDTHQSFAAVFTESGGGGGGATKKFQRLVGHKFALVGRGGLAS